MATTTMTPQRVRRRRTKGWRMPEGAIYVGRGTKWGNPFVYRDQCSGLVRYRPSTPEVIEHEGRCSADGMLHPYYAPDGSITAYQVRWATREEIVELYRRTLVEPDRGMIGATGAARAGRFLQVTVDDVRRELAGQDLACWCEPHHPCHVDLLLQLANS